MKIKRLILVVAVILGVVGLNRSATAEDVVDGVVAIVGNDIILSSEVRAAKEAQKGLFTSSKKMTQGEVLEELIAERLLRQEMDRLKIEVTPEEMNQTLRMVLSQNKITLPQLKAELAKKGISFEAYKKDLRERVRIMKFMRQVIYSNVNVTEDDFEVYRRRYPHKAKQQSEEEIRDAILEVKSKETFESYINGVRERTYVEIKKLS